MVKYNIAKVYTYRTLQFKWLCVSSKRRKYNWVRVVAIIPLSQKTIMMHSHISIGQCFMDSIFYCVVIERSNIGVQWRMHKVYAAPINS